MKRREAWFDGQIDLNPERLVFIDETWTATNMARRYGRCLRGERLRVGVPHGHWKTTTFVAGLRLTGICAPPINRIAFETYVEKVLTPELRPGDVVIMDNLSSHKGPRVREMIKAAGATLSSCRHTRLTSTRSRTPSQSSRPICARPQSAPSTGSGPLSAASSTASPPLNAKTTSMQPDTMQRDRIPL